MIYLNNAATSFPKPPEVLEAVEAYTGSAPYNCLRSGYAGQDKDTIFSCREKLAELFNAPEPNNIIFTSGATEALNLALLGLELHGAHVITTSTEHNSVLRPLYKLKDEGVIELTIVKCDRDGHVDTEEVVTNIKDNTKAVVVNHASNVTGEVLDLGKISTGILSKQKGIVFIVDASQSAGCIPINIKRDNIDILVFTGHKSLYSMPGVGGMYLNNIDLKPLKYGGTGAKSELMVQPDELPLKYEAGTPNIPGIVSLEAGVDFIIKTGIDNIKKKNVGYIDRIIKGLSEHSRIKIYGSKKGDIKVPVMTFNLAGISPEESGKVLEETFDIVTRTGLHCAPLIHKELGTYPDGTVRVSPSYFTTDDDIEKFLYAINEIVGMM